jgi:perosamine synthetase
VSRLNEAALLYSVLVRGGRVSRDEARGRLDAHGIETRPFFWPLHLLPPNARAECMPVAEDLGVRGISLPRERTSTGIRWRRVVQALGDALDS